MRNRTLAICDREENYARRMGEYFLERTGGSSQIQVFTKAEELQRYWQQKRAEVLLIAESFYEELPEGMLAEGETQIFLLQENGKVAAEGMLVVDKYQKPENIVQSVLEAAGEIEEDCPFETENKESVGDGNGGGSRTAKDRRKAGKWIGVYSPIKRCLQTPFSITLGQLLAREHKVLYLNFECYSGLRQLMNREFSTDMMDVMYYFRYAREKLAARLPAMIQSMNGLDFIPPVYSSLDIRQVTGTQWADFCKEIAHLGEYEYLILDLDDGMEGLFDLLQKCDRIYTITKDDRYAVAKMTQYEQILKFQEQEMIADRTVKCSFPLFSGIPADIERMTHGDLARYVKAIIREDLQEGQHG